MDTNTGTRPEPDFYTLPFAAQMIVWATRKQLHSMASSRPCPDEVLSVFHLAEWGALYESILAVVETLTQADAMQHLLLHAVACPRLAPHEISLLNALAYVQIQQPVDAVLNLCEVLRPAYARRILAQLTVLSRQLEEQGQRVQLIQAPDNVPPAPITSIPREVVH